MIRRQKSVSKREQNTYIIDKIMQTIPKLSDKYMKTVGPDEYEEVSRRLSKLTRPFVTDCLQGEIDMFKNLKIQAPSVLLATRTIKIMTLRVLIIPQMGNSKCEFLRREIAVIISQSIIETQKRCTSGFTGSITSLIKQEETEKKATDSNRRERLLIVSMNEKNDLSLEIDSLQAKTCGIFESVRRKDIFRKIEIHDFSQEQRATKKKF